MAEMIATTLALGDPVPAFTLRDTEGDEHAVPAQDAPPATVLVVTCNHCPYVVAWNPRLRAVAEEYQPRGVRFLAINANDASRYPADSFEHMQRFVEDQGWPIPYLHDESQEVARAYGAVCTPDFFGYDADLKLQYRGRLDESKREAASPKARRELHEAMRQVAETGRGPQEQIPSMGCSIKWKDAA
jgi:peroxiredoxin